MEKKMQHFPHYYTRTVFTKLSLTFSFQAKFEKLLSNFRLFDEQFEYGARLPKVFIGDWYRAQMSLLATFRNIVKNVRQQHPESVTKVRRVHK